MPKLHDVVDHYFETVKTGSDNILVICRDSLAQIRHHRTKALYAVLYPSGNGFRNARFRSKVYPTWQEALYAHNPQICNILGVLYGDGKQEPAGNTRGRRDIQV